jgi:hypothetical protein
MRNLTYTLLGFFLLLLVAYIFGMMMYHIFEQKVKDKSLDTVVVHLYPKKGGKPNSFQISHGKARKAKLNKKNYHIEGFESGHKDNCGCCAGHKVVQRVCKPKPLPKGILKSSHSASSCEKKLPKINSELKGFYQKSEPLATCSCVKSSKCKKTPDASEDTNHFYSQNQPDKVLGSRRKDPLVEGFANSYKKCDRLFCKNLFKKTGVTQGFNITEY